ncbi:2Fe-2S iron-sulfur cluster-binding protein [Pseudomonas profundi]|uniref:2Fe-2S iron-sulfur cluster-binding protein n=1 Tax=Pseudomonas profundi TaxID=1981513 RepID=UPI00123C581E|nr:2Fe-2S iron-sulfur cluster-binding protein [Pseudomonas profundi]
MTISVTDRDNHTHVLSLQDRNASTLMELIADAGISILAECGGGCVCATCHIYVQNPDTVPLPAPSEDEENALDSAFNVKTNSRLSCQIPLTEALKGIEIAIAPNWP